MQDTRGSFFDKNGIPRLRLSYCIFADVLGFMDMTAKTYKEGTAEELLRKIHKIVDAKSRELRPDDTHASNWQVKFFTDNLVLGYSIITPESESEFGSAVLDALYYQLEMALNGFFVRGGMSLGALFMDDNLVFGPALIEAYKIEQTVARDPRIVLSSGVVKLMKLHLGYYGRPSDSPQNATILRDADGRSFINYLYGIIDSGDGSHDYMVNCLRKHKEHIESGLQQNKKDALRWSKYSWLANYHNYFCREYGDYLGKTTDCLVDDKLARRQPSRLVRRRLSNAR